MPAPAKPQSTSDQRTPVAQPPQTGLYFQPAASIGQVIEAWSLVYRSYLRAGLIPANPSRLHTVAHAIQPRSVVICGRIGGLTVSTMSGYFDRTDGPGLPLDRVYPDELADLRRDGRTLIEIGLFADRREHIERSVESLLELMRQVTYFAVGHGATDGIISVLPRHAPFYTRLLGFEPIGDVKTYSLVKDNPVVLLRLDWYAKINAEKLPRGLRYFRDNPLLPERFATRCVLDEAVVADSPIARYLAAADANLAIG